MFDMQKFARFLLQKRKEKNITQGQLAEEIGVSTQAVSKWERGEAMPEISKLADLAVALDVTTEDIMSAMDSKDKSYTLEEGQAESITEADEAYLALADKTLIGNVFELAPHLSQNVLKTAIIEITVAKGSSVAKMLFKFADEETLRQCAITVFDMDISVGKGDFAPYLPQEKLSAILLNSVADGNMERAIALLPCCKNEDVVDSVFTMVVSKYGNWNPLKGCIGKIMPSVVIKQGIDLAVSQGPSCFSCWWDAIGRSVCAKIFVGYAAHFNDSPKAWRDISWLSGNVDISILLARLEELKAQGFEFGVFSDFARSFPAMIQDKLKEWGVIKDKSTPKMTYIHIPDISDNDEDAKFVSFLNANGMNGNGENLSELVEELRCEIEELRCEIDDLRSEIDDLGN